MIMSHDTTIIHPVMSQYHCHAMMSQLCWISLTSCFRLNDLEVGEVIGHGFYGSVSKVGVLQCGHVIWLGSHVIDGV